MELTDDQRSDLAALLARSISLGNLESLCVAVLGRSALEEMGNDVAEKQKFASGLVKRLHERKAMREGIAWLQQGLHPNARLTLQLTEILAGRRLDGDAAAQVLLNRYEPFLSVVGTEQVLARVRRTICAIALGDPHNDFRGTGFLVGPDLVMTNFHVVKEYLKVDGATVTQNGPGDQIFCFFDYHGAPTPVVPPSNRMRSSSLCITAAEKWLEYARTDIDGDGTLQCLIKNKEYDCVVLRLSRAIGERPVQVGDVTPRGWLPLRDKIDVLDTAGKRIMVFQHPGADPQQMDIGPYDRLHPSQTRVWYRVNTAKGSSGGAAVDTAGELFALHNAEVALVPPPRQEERLNQGVRIDLITKDLVVELPAFKTLPLPSTLTGQFWSLTDDLSDPRPIIGRTRFREVVRGMIAPGGQRVLTVTGPPGSGVQYWIKLLRRILGAQAPVVVFNPRDIERLSPEGFLDVLIDQLGVAGPGRDKPELRQTEDISRWLRLDLPRWFLERLTAHAALDPSRYPAWVVINTMLPDQYLLWAKNLRDFVAGLAGARDPGQAGIDIPQLRWLFLGPASASLPVAGGKEQDENLGGYDKYRDDFAECMQTAWFALEQEPAAKPEFLKAMAETLKGSAPGVPLRKALSNFVRETVLNAPKGR